MKYQFHKFIKIGCVFINTTLIFCCPEIPAALPKTTASIIFMVKPKNNANSISVSVVDQEDQPYAYRQYFEQFATAEQDYEPHPGYSSF